MMWLAGMALRFATVSLLGFETLTSDFSLCWLAGGGGVGFD